jgi:hypothetical protein
MKASEVLELVRAGFTSAEIKAMEQPAADLPEQVTVAPETVAPEAPAEEIKTDPKLDEIMAEVKALQQKIISKNVTNSEMPAVKEITPEDILAAVIGGKK